MTHRRVWIAVLIFLAVIINYMDRVALSVAAKPIAAEYGFTPVQMGYLFSGFLWTYVVCLVPLGLLVDRTGAKRMVAGGIAAWSLATVATVAASSFTGILLCRLVMGASEATTYPACARVIRDWFPARERGQVTTLFNGGSMAGPAVGSILTAALIGAFSWRIAFAVLGVLGLVWMAVWVLRYDAPERTPWLPAAERALILQGRGAGRQAEGEARSSIASLLRQRSVWGLILMQASVVYTSYLFLTWLPTFLQTTHAVSTANAGYLTAIPYLFALLLSLLVARISDRVLSAEAIGRGRRRWFSAAMSCVALSILLAPLATEMWQILLVLTLVLTGSTTASSQNLTLVNDLLRTPGDAPRVMALTVVGGNTFGLISPIITGYVVSGTGGYLWAFRTAALILVCGVAATLTMARRPIVSAPVPAG